MNAAVQLRVRVIPNARKNEFTGRRADELVLRLNAPANVDQSSDGDGPGHCSAAAIRAASAAAYGAWRPASRPSAPGCKRSKARNSPRARSREPSMIDTRISRARTSAKGSVVPGYANRVTDTRWPFQNCTSARVVSSGRTSSARSR